MAEHCLEFSLMLYGEFETSDDFDLMRWEWDLEFIKRGYISNAIYSLSPRESSCRAS